MHNGYPHGGLASLVQSRGRGEDTMLVHMTPGEVQGLQALALAHGGSLTINPETGLYEAGWLKKLLPMILGAVLAPLTAGTSLGSFLTSAGSLVGGGAAAGIGLLTGGVEALRTGSLKKGLMAGLGAYGGANIATSLSSAGAQASKTAAETASKQALQKEVAQKAAEEYGLVNTGVEAVNPANYITASGAPVQSAFHSIAGGPGTLEAIQRGTPIPLAGSTAASAAGDIGAPVEFASAPSTTAPTATEAADYNPFDKIGADTAASTAPTFANIGTGVKSLVTPAGRSTFMEGLGGGYKTPFGQNASKLATLMAVSNAATPDQQEMGEIPVGDDYVYIPGGFNPMYGSSRDQPYYLPGGYYKKTPQGLTPYDPYGKKTFPQSQTPALWNAAGGGVVPAPNNMYPMANVQHAEYASSIQNPLKTEIVGGYDASVNPFTGEEVGKQVNFDTGGPVYDWYPGKPGLAGAGGVAGPNEPPPPGYRPAAAADTQRTQMEDYYRSLLAPPGEPRSTTKLSNYLGNLEAGLQLPLDKFYPGGDSTKSAKPTTPERPTAQGTGTGTNTEFWRTGGGGGTGTSTGYGYVDPATGQWIWTRTPPSLNGGVSGGTDPGSGGSFGQVKEQSAAPTAQMTPEMQPTGPVGPTQPIGFNNPFSPVAPVEDWENQQDTQPQPQLEQTVQMPDEMRGLRGLQSDTNEFNFGFAQGGIASEYKAGGRLLNGPGDGMSDDIPAVIRGRRTQRAALADGEFVVPADVVSHLGNGSTNAGAKKLHAMMNRVRKARTGKSSQAPSVKTDRFIPA